MEILQVPHPGSRKATLAGTGKEGTVALMDTVSVAGRRPILTP